MTFRKIYAFIMNGYSLLINGVQKKSDSVAKFTKNMQVRDITKQLTVIFLVIVTFVYEEDFLPQYGFKVNVNLYMTPGGGNQGFEAHFDWMDNLILQIQGCKTWKVI